MPLLVPPPTVSDSDLHGLPPTALVASLKQEVSNWLKLYESNEEMLMMIKQNQSGEETSEGIRLDKNDVEELQKAVQENEGVIDRKGKMIARMQEILIEKAGEHAIPAEVTMAEAKLTQLMQESQGEGLSL